MHINRIVGKGDTDKLSVEDLAFYINRGPKSMKQAKTEQLMSFDSNILTKTRAAESMITQICNAVVDDAKKSLNIKDGMVFNKIRTNRTQLENSITTAKNHVAKQMKVNETSHAIAADLENRMQHHGKNQDLFDGYDKCMTHMKTVVSLQEDIKAQNRRIANLESTLKQIQSTSSVRNTLDYGSDENSHRDDDNDHDYFWLIKSTECSAR